MAHKWDDVIRRDDSSDDDSSFTSFLNRKVEECIKDKPLSELPLTDVSDVEAKLESLTSPAITEESPQRLLEPVSAADEKVTELEIRANELPGRVETKLVEHERLLTVDAEWVRISNESYTLAIVDLVSEHGPMAACQKIIEKIHDLNRLRFLIPAQQYGLQNALEELLRSTNAEDRAKLLEMDKKFRSAQKARGVVKEKKEKKAREPKIPKADTGLSKGMRAAKQFHGLGFDKEFTIAKLLEQNLLDKSTGEYLGRLYGESGGNNG